ncbi:MAG: penicillin-binding protein 2 [Prevotellaceae bacterium]|jgi:penicillin-binding protein 2|nr:penicillin-binding protein 2 [Prevotellaceae bacterium]
MQVGIEKRNIIIVVFILVGIVLLLKILSLQVFSDYYKIAAENNAFFRETQYPARGLIYDRNGNELVVNKTVYDIMAIPREVVSIDTAEICRTLGIEKEVLIPLLEEIEKKKKGSSGYQFMAFMRQVPAETHALFQEKSYKFPGFYSQARTNRRYVRGISGNLLGYVNEVDKTILENDKEKYYQQGDYIGRTGIEEAYEGVLRGTKGVSIFVRDVHNRIKQPYNEGYNDTPAVAGKSITTTIDADLQEYAEKLIANKIGGIVALEPSTGEILAMVSSPGFSPELMTGQDRGKNYAELSSDRFKPMFNRALMSSYPPGSTFKLFTALTGLQEGVVTPQTRYGCSMGYRVGRGVGCHAHPSPLDLPRSIMMSCNAYYCHVFRDIVDNPKYNNIEKGLERWIEYAHSFGLGHKLNTDLIGERAGTLPTVERYNNIHGKNRWKSLTIISLAIGQGETGLTPLQLANLSATIANRGYYVTPHVIKKIEGSDTIPARFYEKHHAMVDEKHYDPAIEGMYLAVNSPTGVGATAAWVKVPGLEICGKTGTAQNPPYEDHSIFFCFAPRENPKIAVAVYIENAGPGGRHAAPLATLVVEKYLNGEIGDGRKHIENNVISTDLRDLYLKRMRR